MIIIFFKILFSERIKCHFLSFDRQEIEQKVDTTIDTVNKQKGSKHLIKLAEEHLFDLQFAKSEKCFTSALAKTTGKMRPLNSENHQGLISLASFGLLYKLISATF